MLKLNNIVKIYDTGVTQVQALKGISIEFRRNEFVSILGPSGCGKTTLLNIIGGLDRYTEGDLIVNGKSTKDFTDKDWDTYRNHAVGFVFQSYNLIPHLTALANVELALALSGVSKTERRRRAIEALTEVGLADQLYKKPNQMSGGQMQRVAIARALVNNPDILLADEPTGALDSETSRQVLEILKKVSEDRLVIMVTHNAELAELIQPESSACMTDKSFRIPIRTTRLRMRRKRRGTQSPPTVHVVPHRTFLELQQFVDQKSPYAAHRFCRQHRHYRNRPHSFAVQRLSQLHCRRRRRNARLVPDHHRARRPSMRRIFLHSAASMSAETSLVNRMQSMSMPV